MRLALCRCSIRRLLVVAACCAATVSALAQVDNGPAIEPEAMAALTRMGKFLQTLQSFRVKGEASTEEVLGQDLKVRHDAASTMDVTRPDHVRAEQTSDRRHRLVVYDGKTFTVYSKSSGYYAQAPMTGTVYEFGNKLESEYPVQLPILDLFAWADDKAQPPEIRMARVVGFATIRGVACDQYVFREAGHDWQVWIQRGAQPLPRRLVVTVTNKESRPQYSAEYDWTLNPQIAATAYQFTPPAGAVSVPLARVKEIAVPRR
jgi:hypothetical protein